MEPSRRQPGRDPSSPLTKKALWINLLLYPTHTFPTAAAPVLVGIGLSIHDHVLYLVPALVGFLASWLLHVGGVFIDNYELLRRHPENREHPELIEALQNGSLSLGVLRGAIVFCYLAAIATGPYLLQTAGPLVIAFGVIGVLASWSYAAGPFAYAQLGLADPVFFLMFGVVAVAGTFYVQAAPAYLTTSSWLLVRQALPLDAFLLGLPVGALVTNVLLIDDIRDHQPDRDKGWRTGSVRFGIDWTRAEIAGLTVFAYLAPLWFWLGLAFSPWVLVTYLTAPQALAVARGVAKSERFEDLFPMTPKAAFLALIYASLLALGIAL